MKVQLEQLDLLQPWPRVVLREGHDSIRMLVRVGGAPIGHVMMRPARRREVSPERLRRRIERQFKAGIGELVAGSHIKQTWPTPAVTVAVCTRDRESALDACLASLSKLDYAEIEILVVDNSRDAVPTRALAEKHGVGYLREPKAGLSRARNAALAHARHAWVAFIDDDCTVEPNWLKELVRPIENANVRCVCGLVLPQRLQSISQVVFERHFGHGRGYEEKMFDASSIRGNASAPLAAVGSGASMLVHKDLAEHVGGFDSDPGANPRNLAGCGEDADFFFRLIRNGQRIAYTPRAVAYHEHPATSKVLRRVVHGYAVGQAAYLTKRVVSDWDICSLKQLAVEPLRLINQWIDSVRGKSDFPISLIPLQLQGMMLGPVHYLAGRFRRMRNAWAHRPTPTKVVVTPRPRDGTRAPKGSGRAMVSAMTGNNRAA